MDNKEPLRILHVVTTMNRGGLETLIMNYYRAIDRNAFQFDFLVHRMERSDYEDEIERLGGRVYRIQRLNPFSRSYQHDLYSFFSSHPEYKIVHVHQDCLSAVALKQAMRAGVPVRIAHCHSSHQDKNLKFLIKSLYKGKIARYATNLLSCSNEGGRWMFETSNFDLLPNAIDLTRFFYNEDKRLSYRKEFSIKEDAFVCGHVGRFDEVKNHAFLIDAFAKVVEKDPEAVLILIGSGPLEEQIKQKVRSIGLDQNVRFLGLRTDVADLYSCMDMFIFPSIYEGTPMVLIEAQTAGLPCLISNGIPSDCEVTPLIRRENLETGAVVWAEKILGQKREERTRYQEIMSNSNYNVRFSVRKLQDYYSRLYEKSSAVRGR